MGQELLSAISGSFQLSDQILEDAEQDKAETTAALTEIFRNSINDQILNKERSCCCSVHVVLRQVPDERNIVKATIPDPLPMPPIR